MNDEGYIPTNHYAIESDPTQMVDGNNSLWPATLTLTTMFLALVLAMVMIGVLPSTGGSYVMLFGFMLPAFGCGIGAAATFTCFTDKKWYYFTLASLALLFFIIASPWFAIVALFVWVVFVIS